MNIVTRAALIDDKPAIWQLFESEMKQHIEVIWGWDAAWQVADFDNAFSTSSTYVVEVDGKFSGYFQLDHGVVENYLRMIVLLPACRSLGIGAKLLAEILRLSCRDGRTLSLRVFRANLSAKRFYEREGWLIMAEEGDFVCMRHETSVEAITFNALADPSSRQFEIIFELQRKQELFRNSSM
ncbi:MAG TPA: GNAT family N-acetyltransferase [Burkholderiaceae bacterium]|nr:GNAT family N-acetyltransferase [Burkholderiaceae bacterium]